MKLWGKNGPIRKCHIGFLLAPHSDQSAISNRFHRTQQRYRRTDGRTGGRTDGQNSNGRPDAARYALASVANIVEKKLCYLQSYNGKCYYKSMFFTITN